jgi:hypothetical protein
LLVVSVSSGPNEMCSGKGHHFVIIFYSPDRSEKISLDTNIKVSYDTSYERSDRVSCIVGVSHMSGVFTGSVYQ